MRIGGKLPDKPKVIKSVYTSQGIRIAERRLKLYAATQGSDDSRLLGNAKLGAERGTETGDRGNIHVEQNIN